MKNEKKYSTIIENKGFLAVIASFFVAVFFLLLPAQSQAMVVRGGETYTLDSYATLEDDLYVLGRTLAIAGTTTGDVLSIGSFIESTGKTKDDFFGLGGNVHLGGIVEGDARVAGGKVLLTGTVEEDVFLVGGTVHIEKDAHIEGDLFVIADQLILEGTVDGVVELKARTAELKGVFKKDVRATVSESLSLTGGDSEIGGSLIYSAPREMFKSETAEVKGSIDFTQKGVAREEGTLDVFGLIVSLVLTVVASITFVYFFPARTEELISHTLTEGNWIRLVKGLVVLVAWPLFTLLLMLTLIGFIPGIILLLAYILCVVIAMAFAPVLAGVFLAGWLGKKKQEKRIAWTSLGVIALLLLALLPIIGPLLRFVIFLMAFESIVYCLYEKVWQKRKVYAKETTTIENKEEK